MYFFSDRGCVRPLRHLYGYASILVYIFLLSSLEVFRLHSIVSFCNEVKLIIVMLWSLETLRALNNEKKSKLSYS